jgi:hypothetical protein
MLAALLALLAGGGRLAAGEAQRHEEDLRRILAAWQARQTQVQGLTCKAKVESFYPRGYLSDQAEFHTDVPAKLPNPPVYPEEDVRIADGPCSWSLDFANARIRKEAQLTKPYFRSGDDYELIPDYGLHLFRDGKYRLFRTKDRQSREPAEPGVLSPDVYLYESASHQFLLWFSDLPLLWLGGGVTGRYPLPTAMRRLDAAQRFTVQGLAQWQGIECLVLTVQEQESPSSVREFWVHLAPPYPIHLCRAKNGDVVSWQLEVKYRNQAQQLVPETWTYDEYSVGKTPGLFSRRTYQVEEFQLNPALEAQEFEKRLEPGTTAFHVEKNNAFQVRPDGSLGPLSPRDPSTSRGSVRYWILGGSLFALLLAVVLTRRSQTASSRA